MTYATIEHLKAYASTRGLSLPDDDECLHLLVLAHDWLESQHYKGSRTAVDQDDSWPRSGVSVDGRLLPDSEVPYRVIISECQLAIDSQGADLMPTIKNGKDVIKERVEGVVEREYAEGGSLSAIPQKAHAMLKPLLMSSYGFMVCRA